ncbi:MAG TPA: peptide-methionine (S)-S-oxide reductase MsrA, partial [Mucilaginibacter sp.]
MTIRRTVTNVYLIINNGNFMKRIILYVGCILLFAGCVQGQSNDFAALPKPAAGEEVATFGGGCFWSMSEAMSELKGVNKVVSGYAGGTTKNPSYQDVGSQTTGHAECVQIYYDPKVISFTTLVNAFFFAHDPTELNRQGPDEGTDYRSIAFYRTPEEKTILLDVMKKINSSKHYPE